jgi:hypothetical protein
VMECIYVCDGWEWGARLGGQGREGVVIPC